MQEIKCRNYDCKRILSSYEIKKMAKLPYPLQSKFNYCHKCRRVDRVIDRIQCHFCKVFMKYTTFGKHICDKCKEERLKVRLHRNHLKRDGLSIKQAQLVDYMISKGYSRLEIMKELDMTDGCLRSTISQNKKKRKKKLCKEKFICSCFLLIC